MDIESASRFARLALDCVHKEYPNKISHSMNSEHYEGGHWLGSYAVYLVTRRGIAK